MKKRDKIFNNTFWEKSLDTSKPILFTLKSACNAEEVSRLENLEIEIHEIVKALKNPIYLKKDDNNKYVKLNKEAINEIYGIALDSLSNNYKKVELYAGVSNYFNITHTKFYNSLSNKYKEDLIDELDKSTNALKRMGIHKLF